MRTCDHCGMPVSPNRPAKTRFCNNRCRNAFHSTKRLGEIAAVRERELTWETRQWAINVMRESRTLARALVKETLGISDRMVEELERQV